MSSLILSSVRFGSSQFIILLLFYLFSNGSLSDELDKKFHIKFDSYTFSEPTSIDSFLHNFNGKFGGGETASSFSQLSLGIEYKSLTVSLIKRLDYFYQFSSETAQFYYNLENEVPFLPNVPHRLELNMNHLKATGIKVGYKWKLSSNIDFYLFGSYLAASDFYQANLSGDTIWLDNEKFSIQAPAEIFSAHNELLAYPENNSKGEGLAFDITFDWRIYPYLNASFKIQDIYSEVDWEGALFTQVNRWQIYQKDSDNVVDATPLLEGEVLNYSQKLPIRWLGELSFTSNAKTRFFVKFFHSQYSQDLQLGSKIEINRKKFMSLGWNFISKSIELGYKTDYFHILLMLNSINPKNTNSFGINFGLTKSFI